jgi:hypothetical protein
MCSIDRTCFLSKAVWEVLVFVTPVPKCSSTRKMTDKEWTIISLVLSSQAAAVNMSTDLVSSFVMSFFSMGGQAKSHIQQFIPVSKSH